MRNSVRQINLVEVSSPRSFRRFFEVLTQYLRTLKPGARGEYPSRICGINMRLSAVWHVKDAFQVLAEDAVE